MMHICGGLVRPESENVAKPYVFKSFSLKGQGRPEDSKRLKVPPRSCSVCLKELQRNELKGNR